MRFLADHHIRLNITPSSNYLRGRVGELDDIRKNGLKMIRMRQQNERDAV